MIEHAGEVLEHQPDNVKVDRVGASAQLYVVLILKKKGHKGLYVDASNVTGVKEGRKKYNRAREKRGLLWKQPLFFFMFLAGLNLQFTFRPCSAGERQTLEHGTQVKLKRTSAGSWSLIHPLLVRCSLTHS